MTAAAKEKEGGRDEMKSVVYIYIYIYIYINGHRELMLRDKTRPSVSMFSLLVVDLCLCVYFRCQYYLLLLSFSRTTIISTPTGAGGYGQFSYFQISKFQIERLKS